MLLVTCVEGDFVSTRKRSLIFENEKELNEERWPLVRSISDYVGVNMYTDVNPTLVSLTDLFH
jgi:hypothetical protein